MRKGKFLLPGLFVVTSLTFVVLWALADVISVSTSTEILGIWATNNNTTAIVASHSWDVTCNNTVTVFYQYSHMVMDEAGETSTRRTDVMNETVEPPGDVKTETWTTYWSLPGGDYTATCITGAGAEGISDTSADSADFTVP